MTMRDNERDALVARLRGEADRKECVPTRTPTLSPASRWLHPAELRTLLAQAAEALAAPAEGVDVEELRKIADGIDPKIGTMGCAETARRIRALIDSAGGVKCGHCGKPKRADRALDACACATLTYTPQPAEGDGAVLPPGYKVQRHIFGKWMYVVGDHGSANYWNTRDEAVQKAWEHHERQLTRPAATAVVPDAPLKVFDSGPWIYEPDGVRFSGQQLDGAAFAEYRRLLASAPAAPKGGVVDEAMVERALAAYLRVQDAGESLYGCVTSALTAALATGEQP